MNNLIIIKIVAIIIDMVRSQLISEIEKLKLHLPSYGEQAGTGTILDPLRTEYPVLDGLYSLATTIDNIMFAVEELLKFPSRE